MSLKICFFLMVFASCSQKNDAPIVNAVPTASASDRAKDRLPSALVTCAPCHVAGGKGAEAWDIGNQSSIERHIDQKLLTDSPFLLEPFGENEHPAVLTERRQYDDLLAWIQAHYSEKPEKLAVKDTKPEVKGQEHAAAIAETKETKDTSSKDTKAEVSASIAPESKASIGGTGLDGFGDRLLYAPCPLYLQYCILRESVKKIGSLVTGDQ